MARKEALTQKQQADVCALLAEEVSVKTLANIYGVSEDTIHRVREKNPDFAKLCGTVKKEAEEKAVLSVEEWVSKSGVLCITLLGKIMSEVMSRDLSEESIRDLAGLFKIMREAFVPKSTNTETEHTGTVKIEFVETNHADRDK